MQNQAIVNDKKQRIIQAAMENFAKNGYKKTTIDEIVADAGISKGLVFHYFGSKKKLYLYLYELAYGMVYHRVTKVYETASSDLFERIRQTEQVKLEVMNQYPYMLDFLVSAHKENDEQLQGEIGRAKDQFPDWSASFLLGIDTFKFRDGVELDKVLNLILWCTNGVLKERRDQFMLEEIFAEMGSYLELMRRAFYKEEYL